MTSLKTQSSIVLAAGAAAVATKYLDDRYALVKDARLLAGFGAFGAVMKYHELTNWTAADGLEEAAASCTRRDPRTPHSTLTPRDRQGRARRPSFSTTSRTRSRSGTPARTRWRGGRASRA